MRRNPNAGLFNGFWLDVNGKEQRRIRRDEYPTLYRLWRTQAPIRLGITIVGMRGPWHPAPGAPLK